MYEAALSPYRIRDVEFRNRIMTTGYVTNMARDHCPSEEHVAHYRDIAQGGVSLIVMAFLSVHPTAGHVRAEIHGFDDRIVPGLRRVVDAVHEQGARIVCQLGHTGRQGTGVYTGRALWAPSAVPCPRTREMPKAMELEDIEEIVEAHVRAAARVKKAGADGAEIHSGYGGYLLSSFLSPYMNFRDDEYGGTLENRLRLPLAVAQAIRAEVGGDFLVGMQINGSDLAPGGLDEADAQAAARALVTSGALDYLTVKAGTYLNADINVPDMQHPRGLWIRFAAGIKQAVGDFPVFAVGRITDPAEAEEVIESGAADMVAMTRQHIADPETVRKMIEGRPEDIRKCVACNQGCIDYVARGHHITCIHNPAAGFERELGLGTLQPATKPRRIVVVGGGPAGMKAAEIAARRGHDVTLLEAEQDLGGQIRWAASIAGREEMGEVVLHLVRQLEKLPVTVQTGVLASADHVAGFDPDAVVVATGSAPTREVIGLKSFGITSVTGASGPNVFHLGDYFGGEMAIGRRVAVIDDGEGGWKSISVALQLAVEGREVTLVTPLPFVGAGVGPFSAGTVMRRIEETGLRTAPLTVLTEIDDSGWRGLRFGKPTAHAAADTILLAGWFKPRETLYIELRDQLAPPVVRIGDAVASRTILQAIHEGERAARAL